MNDREKIQKRYSDWVDDVCEVCDWKTHFDMNEVQSKYSALAIEYAIEIIDEMLKKKKKQKIGTILDLQDLLVEKKKELKKLLK